MHHAARPAARLASALLAILLVPLAVAAQQDATLQGTLQGTVRDAATQRPLAGISVTLLARNDPLGGTLHLLFVLGFIVFQLAAITLGRR